MSAIISIFVNYGCAVAQHAGTRPQWKTVSPANLKVLCGYQFMLNSHLKHEILRPVSDCPF